MNRTMEEIFRSNPAMRSAITDYVPVFQNFTFNTVTMTDGVSPVPLLSRSMACELILVCARPSNAAAFNMWNGDMVAANVGMTLAAGNMVQLKVDNVASDIATAMCKILSQALNRPFANTVQRNALDAALWKCVGSAGDNLIADVAFATLQSQ
jgi:hypothetical protein